MPYLRQRFDIIEKQVNFQRLAISLWSWMWPSQMLEKDARNYDTREGFEQEDSQEWGLTLCDPLDL